MCFKCRAGEGVRDFFVDLGFDTDYEGTVYLCNDCMADIGILSNTYITVPRHHQVIEYLDKAIADLNTLNEKHERYAVAFLKVTGNDLNTFCENLETMANGYKRTELDGTTSPDVTPIVSASYEPVPNTEYTEPDDISTAGIDPPIFTVPTFS